MRIRIVCPVSLAYEGDAAFVSIPSTDGEFGVLPAHSSEICTIDCGYVRVYPRYPRDTRRQRTGTRRRAAF